MSCKRTVQEWRNAIEVLNSYAAEFSGMEDKILPLLKYSYDSLNGDEVKSCLLYCALFPEDAKILEEELIEYWISEDIIDGSKGIEKAENKGYDIIGSLVGASLLMEGIDLDRKAFVCMHDVVREMALWIASELGIQKEAFFVHAGVGLREMPKVKNGNVVRRMSLMKNKISYLPGVPKFMELTTLLLKRTNLKAISSEFFKFMPKLLVLDLSGNVDLFEVPNGISELVSLQYLSLSGSGIHHLPEVLQDLKKLIHLDLEGTWKLSSIIGISNLHSLKVLKLAFSGFAWDLNTVKELETLENLEILTTTINRLSDPEQYFSSRMLMSRTRFLKISNNSSMESSGISLSSAVAMDKLREFNVHGCSISVIKMGRMCSFLSLVEVRIERCKCLRELTFLMLAPSLRTLYVVDLKDLEDIINKEKACEYEESKIVPFPKLNYLHLADLPKLKNVYWSPLPFPCLKHFYVKACPNLRKLPLDSKSGTQGDKLMIGCEEKVWFESVEWVDEVTKTRFLASYI